MNRLLVRCKAICSRMLIVFMLTSMLPAIHVSAAGVTPPDSDAWTPYQQFLNSDVSKKEDMRATWIVTVYNSDWPSSASLAITDTAARVEKQKQELSNILDAAVASNLNAVMFQVRPSSDALYKSDLVPWSTVMTGTPGGDPGFDPLEYAIDEAHKRGIELHAWFNPYRAATAVNDAMVAQLKALPKSIFNTHFDWIKKAYDGVYVVDPGIPEAQAWIADSVMEVVNKYDIDGVHFDDYFYHEGKAYDYDDKATFEKYKGGFTDIGDWRRNNTYKLISDISQKIRSAKPWVQFGISPAGMWGNIKDGHVNGSPTAGGGPNYDRAFADTLRWGNEGLIDYLTPQVYWPFGRDVAPYGVIATWWADHLTNPNTKLYMGMGLYRVNDTTNPTETGFLDPYAKEEIIREIQLNTNYRSDITGRGIDGSFLYQGSNIVPGSRIYKKEAVEEGVRTAWVNKAIAPKSTWKSSVAPAMPTNVTAEAVDGVTQVTWTSNDETGSTAYYAIYRFAQNENLDTSDSTKIIAVVGKAVDSDGKDITSYTDTAISDPSKVQYVVTALDRLQNESSPNAPTPVSAIDADITTAAGTAPVLPLSVKVNMTSGSPANMMVKWDKITDPNLYSAAGNSFDVTGKVIHANGTQTEMTVTAHVSVVAPAIKYINPVIVRTEQNTAPVFPATVDVIYTDSTVSSLPVIWETPDPEDYKNAAPFDEYRNPSVKGIQGIVDGTNLKAEGNYIVYPAVNLYAPIAVTTRVGIPPILPPSVNTTYTDGTSSSVAVVWDDIPAENYASINDFTVKGTVEGAAMKVEAAVTVESAVNIVSIDPVYVKTGIGVAPKLPNTVKVTYDDGTKDTVLVTWPIVDPAVDCLTTHRFTVTGTINGTSTNVTATVEVAAVIVLDDFENGVVNSGAAQSMIKWTGDSASSTPPTLSYDTAIKHSGNSSLKVDYKLSKVAGTASAYVRPNQGTGLVFKPGEVPQKIGFWVYGNNVTTFALRAEFRSGITAGSTNTNQNISNTLNFTGWKYLEYTVAPSYQTTGLTITLMPGIVATSSNDKVDSTIYIDDLVAVYGSETKDTAEISGAIAAAQSLYDSTTAGTGHGQYPLSERTGLNAAIDAAASVMNNPAAVMADLYSATDLLNSAVEAYIAAQIVSERHQIIEDYEDHGSGKSIVDWINDGGSTKPTISYNNDPNYVKDGNRSFKIDYNFAGTTGTASAYVKGASYPNQKLKFTGENTPNKIGFWLYGNDETIFSLRAEIRKADGSSATTANFLPANSVMKSGWNFVTYDVPQATFNASTGLLLNIMPGLVETSAAGRVNSTIYIDDLTAIYNVAPAATLNKTGLIGAIATAKSLLLGAVEGTQGGQYPIGSTAILNDALIAAQSLVNSTVQSDIDLAAETLNAAVNTFKTSQIPLIDIQGLKAAIDAAKAKHDLAVEGALPGQYQSGAKAALQAAIDAANTVYNNAGATQGDVEAAKTALAQAVADFDGMVVSPLVTIDLDAAIAKAKALHDGAVAGTEPGQYPQQSIDDLLSAITAATTDKADAETQSDIDRILNDLNPAIKAFEDAMVPLDVDKTELIEAIADAQAKVNSTVVGTLGGQYPQNAKTAVTTAIAAAQVVLGDIHADQDAIDVAVAALKTEVAKYLAARIAAPWDKYHVPEETPVNKREMRAAWISTVVNIDWPSTDSWKIEDTQARAAAQKADLIKILDDLAETGANAVMFQVRPTSDAFYKSELAPWSYWLTGKQDVDPGFDPLEFAIEEAHKRNLELHAWANPYRVSMPAAMYKDESGKPLSDLKAVGDMLSKVPDSIYAKHPEWVKVGTNRFVLDPGIPEAAKYVEDSVMEIVENYDIDGIHFDDYFYVGSNGGFDAGYSDQSTYDTYADKTEFPKIEDWRRNNTYTLVKNLHNRINAEKPWVKFGISPAGVWGNIKDGHPDGSETSAGIPNYDRAYADTKKWVLEEIIDYITPQVYWTFANSAAGYGVVSSWWSDLLKNNPDVKTQLYMGVGLYWLDPKEAATDKYWTTEGVGDQEIARQLKFNAANPNIDGTMIFTYNSFKANSPNANSAASLIKNDLWATKALMPAMPWKGGVAPEAPVLVNAAFEDGSHTISWQDNDENTAYYAVYRFEDNEAVNINNPVKLIATVRKSETGLQSYIDHTGKPTSNYVVTALNRLSDESIPSNESTQLPIIDTTALDSVIVAAVELMDNAEVGTEAGQYPQEAIDALTAAVTIASAIKDNAKTQEEIDRAVEGLKVAVESFKAAQIPDPNVKVEKVSLDKETLQLNVGGVYQLNAIITPSGAANKNVTWTSSDDGIAAVDNTGKVTAIAEGIAVITVTTEDGNKTATSVVTVSMPSETIDTTELDNQIQIATDLRDTAAIGTNPGQYPQSAKDALEAAITAALTAKADAKTQEEIDRAVEGLKVAVESFKAAQIPDPNVKVEEVSLDKETLQLNVGGVYQFKATITPSGAANKNVTWTSSDDGIAAVDNTGKVTAIAEGIAVITVTTEDGNKTATSVVTVSEPSESIDTTELDNQIQIATDLRDTAAIGTKPGQYPQSAKDALEAAITAALTAKADAKTQEEIDSATVNLKSAVARFIAAKIPAKVIHVPIHVTGVSLDKQTLELKIGDESQLTAAIRPSNADLMEVTWKSSNENVAIVDRTGRVVAKGSGTAIITVTTTDGNMIATCIVNVSDPATEEEETKPEENVEVKFSDILGHWAEASIKLAAAKGIISGYADGTFKPKSEVTRAEFAVMLARMLNLQGNGAELEFNDKAAIGSWAKQGIAQAVQAGIVKGYSDGSFRPNAKISRVEMVTMIVNALGFADNSKATTVFADDAEIPAWASAAVAAAVENGLVQGVGGNKFAPNQTATRAESVVVLLRALEFASK
ncbi:family 10 glycosylhydrolase [Paenibacillus sp. NPDC057967]|uniref:family 10 glycosylhydrolase n=1 Tax=Paenibacillus sp. NPDC057967 TaxID=3346293 RepID=UPI0036DBDBD0